MKTNRGIKEKITTILPTKTELINAVPETIAATAIYFPIDVFLETLVSGMDNTTSMIARVGGLLTTYIIMPYVMRGRNAMRKLTKTHEHSSGTKKFISDTAFALGFGIATKAALYTGAQLLGPEPFNYESLAIAAGTVGIIATATAGATFYVLDVFKEITGYKPYERTPMWLRERKRYVQKGLATSLVLGSLALGACFYKLNAEGEGLKYFKNEHIEMSIKESELKKEYFGGGSERSQIYINDLVNENLEDNQNNNVNNTTNSIENKSKTAYFTDFLKYLE